MANIIPNITATPTTITIVNVVPLFMILPPFLLEQKNRQPGNFHHQVGGPTSLYLSLTSRERILSLNPGPIPYGMCNKKLL
jgi:hypothetical protein